MKSWIKITIGTIVLLAVVVVLWISNTEQKEVNTNLPVIHIAVKGENAFLTEKELYLRLKRKGLIFNGQTNAELKIHKVETFIKNMTEVLDAKVYTNLGGSWNIDVEIRRPIARIFNKYGESFYLDELGHTIATSYLYTARVVVVTGNIYDKKGKLTVDKINKDPKYVANYSLDDIYRISRYVANDKLFANQICQINKEKNGKYVLIPRVGEQKIIFGSAYSNEEVKVKFRKLADFYREGLPYEGWSAYDCIDLTYDNQVVCSKKQ